MSLSIWFPSTFDRQQSSEPVEKTPYQLKSERASALEDEIEDMSVVDEYAGGYDYGDESMTRRLLTGVLADDIRKALGFDAEMPVYITERGHEIGTDMTREVEWDVEVDCGGVHRAFTDNGYISNNLMDLIDWIDEETKRREYLDNGGAAALYGGAL